MQESKVVLPEPFGPDKTVISPGFKANETGAKIV
jgi:hypothetical protein